MKGFNKHPQFTIRAIHRDIAAKMIAQFHAYKSTPSVNVYCLGAFEKDKVTQEEKLVAVFTWQPPAPGASLAICPEAPHAVLALSRMVALPREERQSNLARMLKWQMKNSIDRGRWPILVTYSDEGLGHNGDTYRLSGWNKTERASRRQFTNSDGERTSSYANGVCSTGGLQSIGSAFIQRWEHKACANSEAALWVTSHGWKHQAIPGKKWRSGAQAYRWVNTKLS